MSNEQLLQLAKAAIAELYGDMSVSPEKALENMEELHADIEGYIDGLPDADDQ
jgi:hypothetical protein